MASRFQPPRRRDMLASSLLVFPIRFLVGYYNTYWLDKDGEGETELPITAAEPGPLKTTQSSTISVDPSLSVVSTRKHIDTAGNMPYELTYMFGPFGFLVQMLATISQRFGFDINPYLMALGLVYLFFRACKAIWPPCQSTLEKLFTRSILIYDRGGLWVDINQWLNDLKSVNPKLSVRGRATVADYESDAPKRSRRSSNQDTFSKYHAKDETASTSVNSQIGYFPPADGRVTWFWYGWHVIIVRFRYYGDPGKIYASDPVYLQLTTVWLSSEPLKAFLNECRLRYADRNSTTTLVRRNVEREKKPEWGDPERRYTRDIVTIDLDENVKSELIADVRSYLQPFTRRMYERRGIPYRRGWLLYGPPGCGKTSMILALAGLFKLNIYTINISQFRFGDNGIEKLFKKLPERCIILTPTDSGRLEDIDSAGIRREDLRFSITEQMEESPVSDYRGQMHDFAKMFKYPAQHDSSPNCSHTASNKPQNGERKPATFKPITLSGLLNVIDGIASSEGRLLVMTTNHIEKLDEALIRPGRIDRRVFFGPASRSSAKAAFLRMYSQCIEDFNSVAEMVDFFGQDVLQDSTSPPPSPRSAKQRFLNRVSKQRELGGMATQFAKKIPEKVLTPAEIQAYLLMHMNDPKAALAGTEAWVTTELLRQALPKHERNEEDVQDDEAASETSDPEDKEVDDTTQTKLTAYFAPVYKQTRYTQFLISGMYGLYHTKVAPQTLAGQAAQFSLFLEKREWSLKDSHAGEHIGFDTPEIF